MFTKGIKFGLRTTQSPMVKKMKGVTLTDEKKADWVRELTRFQHTIVEMKKSNCILGGHLACKRIRDGY